MARSNYEKYYRGNWKNPWFEWSSGGIHKHIEHLYVALIFLPGNHSLVIPWQLFTLFWDPTSLWIKLPVTLWHADSFNRIANSYFCGWCFERRKQSCYRQWRWIPRLYRQFRYVSRYSIPFWQVFDDPDTSDPSHSILSKVWKWNIKCPVAILKSSSRTTLASF